MRRWERELHELPMIDGAVGKTRVMEVTRMQMLSFPHDAGCRLSEVLRLQAEEEPIGRLPVASDLFRIVIKERLTSLE